MNCRQIAISAFFALILSVPAMAAETIITQFAAGHGYTKGAGGAISDDTGDTIIAGTTQSLKLISGNDNAECHAIKNSQGPWNMNGRGIRIWVKMSDLTSNLVYAVLHLSSDNLATTDWQWNIKSMRVGITMLTNVTNQPLPLSFYWNETITATGAINRSAINSIEFQMKDNTGGAITAHLYQISMIDNPPAPVISFTCDDGLDPETLVERPVLWNYKYSATMYTIPDTLGQPGYMAVTSAAELNNTYGWQIGSHHETDITTMGAAVGNTLASVRSWLTNKFPNNGNGTQDFAYPNGMMDNYNVTPQMKLYYRSGRLVSSCMETIPPADPYWLHSYSVVSYTTQAQVKTAIDQCKQENGWLILVFHKIANTIPDINTWLLSDFTAVVNYVNQKQIQVKTITQVLSTPTPTTSGSSRYKWGW